MVKTYEPLLKLQHENVVKLLGCCPQAGQIILEYCEKRLGELLLHTLADLLRHLGDSFPQELQLNALADIAEGLNYIHAQNIVHGDLKPQNILVNGEGDDEFVFKLADYSSSNVEHMYASSKSSTSLRQLMTPSYAAPELFSDIGSCLQPTKESDIYSFGILAYEVIFQTEAWPIVNFQLIPSVKAGHRPSIPSNGPHLLSLLVKSCWHHDSSQRPSAERVIERLEDLMATISSNKEMEHVAASEASYAASSTPSVNESSDHIRVRDKQTYSTTVVTSSTEQQHFDDDYETDTMETHSNEN